jgi:hypothetical protein
VRLKHKFNAVRVETDGIKFPSKKEARRYLQLKLLKESGDIIFFLRQTPFHLSGGVKYVCDFLIFWADGNVTIEDVKGMKTSVYVAKKKMVEATYPIEITEI